MFYKKNSLLLNRTGESIEPGQFPHWSVSQWPICRPFREFFRKCQLNIVKILLAHTFGTFKHVICYRTFYKGPFINSVTRDGPFFRPEFTPPPLSHSGHANEFFWFDPPSVTVFRHAHALPYKPFCSPNTYHTRVICHSTRSYTSASSSSMSSPPATQRSSTTAGSAPDKITPFGDKKQSTRAQYWRREHEIEKDHLVLSVGPCTRGSLL